MGTELFNSSPVPLFLGQMDRCLLTLEYGRSTDPRGGTPLEAEHLIPRVTRRRHKRLLVLPKDSTAGVVDLIEAHENKICLCDTCHRKIDEGRLGKIAIYRKFGLTGLMEEIALYPRSPDLNLLVVQYHQWRELFSLLQRRFRLLKEAPPHFMSEYSQAYELVDRYLYRWEQGNFELGRREAENHKRRLDLIRAT